MTKIKLNDVIDILTSVVSNSREIVHFNLTKEVNTFFTPPEPPYEQTILIVSVNTMCLNDSKDFDKILNTIRYCGLTDVIKIGYSDKSSILLDITINVTNLNVYYEYDFLNEAGGLRKLSIK